MAQNLFDSIALDTYTVQELTRRINVLRDYFRTTVFSGASQIPKDLDPADSEWLTKFLREKNDLLGGVTKDTLAEIFKAQDAQAEKIKPLVIFVSITLPRDEIDLIGRRLRETYGNTFFIDVRVDPLLIGGAALAWKGIYKDYSLRQKIKENRETIIESFQKYIR